MDLDASFHNVDSAQSVPLAHRSREELEQGVNHGLNEINQSSDEVGEMCLMGYAHAANNLWYLLSIDTHELKNPAEFKDQLKKNILDCVPYMTRLEEMADDKLNSDALLVHVKAFRKAMCKRATHDLIE